MSLETAIEHIRQRYGNQALTRGPPVRTVDRRDAFAIRTGFAQLDDALGTGGLPKGRIVELAGRPTSGRTTLALHFLAQAQAQGGWVSYVDPANTFDADHAHRCGMDLSHLVVGVPDDLEQTLAMVEALATADGLSAVALDTEGLHCHEPGAGPRVTAFFRRLVAPLSRSGAVLVVLRNTSADQPVLSALPLFASVRLLAVRERWIRDFPFSEGSRRYWDVRGYEARIEVLKNRLGPPGRSVVLAIGLDGS
jgi:hypothetical protein